MIATDRLDYRLPAELIAQSPAERRDGSRLLVVERGSRALSHRMFSDLPEYLRQGDILIRNIASVLPARLRVRRPTGGGAECLLLRKTTSAHGAGEIWQCLVRRGRRLSVGAVFRMEDASLSGEVIASMEDGTVHVRFTTRTGETVAEVAQQHLLWPHPWTLAMESCGRPGSDYDTDTRTVTMCYEQAFDFAELYRAYVPTKPAATPVANTRKTRSR